MMLIKKTDVGKCMTIINIQNSLSLIGIQPTLKDMRKRMNDLIKFFFPNFDDQEELSTLEISIFFILLVSVVMIATVYI